MANQKNEMLKASITEEIDDYVKLHMKTSGAKTKWGRPLVGFANAEDPYILNLKEIVSPFHAMPKDVLEDASIIVAYYLPFTKELAESNAAAGRMASVQWALAYEETNELLVLIGEHLINYLKEKGYKAAISEHTKTIRYDTLLSDWSHRHFAYAAGLGTFGINNMLITEAGCCGRFFSLVTNIDVDPDIALKKELCLYKKNGKCLICMDNCPMNAISTGKFDRHKCYSMCLENSLNHVGLGHSYSSSGSGEKVSAGIEVCGKCITASPCAFWGK